MVLHQCVRLSSEWGAACPTSRRGRRQGAKKHVQEIYLHLLPVVLVVERGAFDVHFCAHAILNTL
jgi:hypothetical protein